MVLLTAIVALLPGETAVATAELATANSQKIDPALQVIIAEQADTTIPVIVQKSGDSNQAEQLLVQLGGSVSQTYPIINGFAAQISSNAVYQFAAAESVAYISLDTEVETSDKVETLNLLENPGFESGFAGWGVYGFATISGDAYAGANALETNTEAYQLLPVASGETIVFSVWAKQNGDPSWSGVGLYFYDINGYFITENVVEIVPTTMLITSTSIRFLRRLHM